MGPTFGIDQLGWIDFETKGRLPISVGTDRYARNAQATLLAWAIGDREVQVTSMKNGSCLEFMQLEPEFRQFWGRVMRGEAWFVAHNASFDRAIWNHATKYFPPLKPHHIIDTRVQAVASGLPAALDAAAKFATGRGKDAAGKDLIKLFTLPDSVATSETHPVEWMKFSWYAARDVEAMRDLFKHTRQLPLAEWQEYWAAEAINDRGVMIDTDLVEAAAHMAVHDKRLSAAELMRLTAGAVTSVDQVQRMSSWLMAVLPSDGRDIMIKREQEVDEDGAVTRPQKTTLDRDQVEQLIAYLEDLETLTEPLKAALRVLQIRLYGGSKTPAKFSKLLAQQQDGVIRNQYVFNGASQTGRFSARGAQIHNLVRDASPYEIDAIDALVTGVTPEDFAVLGDNAPISRKLSLLIRPTMVAEQGNAFVWGDWANIEARLLPWLTKDSQAEERLDIFRAVDRDPSIPDLYTRTAAQLSGVSVDQVDEKMRQRGKITELALGFGGSTNALLSMAGSFGLHLTEAAARETVVQWRQANPWANRFWGRHNDREGSFGLWGALNRAIETQMRPVPIGRVTYIYLPEYLGGSLLCQLPSGRFLTYRRIRWEMVDIKDDDDVVTDVERQLRFSRDMGRVKFWPGLACENIIQATAADLLRAALVRLNDGPLPVRLHTHDEILVEVPESDVNVARILLRAEMERGQEWTEGLPIKADITVCRWYSKSKTSWGL